MIGRWIICLLMLMMTTACSATYHLPGPAIGAPQLQDDRWIAADGASLPLRRWQPDTSPRAVLIAVHGMNDYSNFFHEQGQSLARHGIISYAYDQRGFGAAPHPGLWSSDQAMADDLRAITHLLADAHPGLPLVIFGESMGGAVTMLAASQSPALPIQGVILSAPAVWGRDSMGWFKRSALWISYHIAPGWTLTGKGLEIWPSDNIDMLRKLSADPLVIKETRIDTIKGLVDLMDAAAASPPRLTVPALILYGERDEIIPKAPVQAMLNALPHLGGDQMVKRYAQGYHMLTRDLQAHVVLDDMAHWILEKTP